MGTKDDPNDWAKKWPDTVPEELVREAEEDFPMPQGEVIEFELLLTPKLCNELIPTWLQEIEGDYSDGTCPKPAGHTGFHSVELAPDITIQWATVEEPETPRPELAWRGILLGVLLSGLLWLGLTLLLWELVG